MLERVTRVELAANYTVLAIFFAYCALPLILATQQSVGDHYFELAAIAGMSTVLILAGSRLPIFDRLFHGESPHLAINETGFQITIWATFLIFAITTWVTSEQIPLLAALSGADPDTIAVLRERFLKSREGWQGSFVYINAILSGALLPYAIALLFLRGNKYRWAAFLFFLLYCISFVEKAFFFKAALPLGYLVIQRKIRFPVSPAKLVVAMTGLLLLVTMVSGAGSSDGLNDGEAFFSIAYVPQSPLDHLLWRSIAIPVVTAADAIRVFNEDFGGKLFCGATSSLFSGVFGFERVEFERLVFAAQWGQNETGTGSANSVFFTEAFVNFGWVGVAIFSLVIGLTLRMFSQSKNEAFRSLWLLFCMGIYTSGLIGLLFSNGFLLLLVLNLFARLVPKSPTKSPSRKN
jgi:hypothetical protein